MIDLMGRIGTWKGHLAPTYDRVGTPKMVQLKLEIKAELENLTNFQPQGGCDDPDFSYYFKLKCGNCGEVSQKESCVTL